MKYSHMRLKTALQYEPLRILRHISNISKIVQMIRNGWSK